LSVLVASCFCSHRRGPVQATREGAAKTPQFLVCRRGLYLVRPTGPSRDVVARLGGEMRGRLRVARDIVRRHLLCSNDSLPQSSVGFEPLNESYQRRVFHGPSSLRLYAPPSYPSNLRVCQPSRPPLGWFEE